MTNFAAFCEGFWSAWDFTRPFSEKPRLRSQAEDYDEWEYDPSMSVGIWETVGNYLYKAIDNHQREFSGNVSKQ